MNLFKIALIYISLISSQAVLASIVFQCNEKNMNLTIASSGKVTLKTNQETCDGIISSFDHWEQYGGFNTTIRIFSGLCASPSLRNSFITLHHYNIVQRSIMPTNISTEVTTSGEPFIKKKCEVTFINTSLLLLLKNKLSLK